MGSLEKKKILQFLEIGTFHARQQINQNSLLMQLITTRSVPADHAHPTRRKHLNASKMILLAQTLDSHQPAELLTQALIMHLHSQGSNYSEQ